MKNPHLPIAVFVLLLCFTSCENLEEKLQEKVNLINEKAGSLDSLMNKELEKINSLDSLVNKELDKVQKLDSMLNREIQKVSSVDSLFNSTGSKIDSMVQDKVERIKQIGN
ncbi:hypothetical protein [Algoriphagus hitonicola]|uniref:Uncharacterized protein n=1 Tax=Algoriphagus hitonicola TaxID=435880 RepID=A0A1I2NF11_9BACT|nr:hypothetical protein [Algoriphagus hitonicola]SFG02525.1 hypothetical protein SAMN04487988_10193 [Algoriphagus hitonicola]